ncbi:MAG: hypothetical protein HOP00_07965 [Nitrospira sp.]|nr:hypothetical protein [Nitrospira sp.]
MQPSQQAPPMQPASPPSAAVAPTLTPTTPVAQSNLLTEKDQAELAKKDLEGQSTDARKLILEAVNDSLTAQNFKRQAQELHNIVTKAAIGNAVVDGVPLAGNVMSFWRDNAQVKKLNENIINMFIKPGQSQVNNTIVERQMTGAQVPGLYTEPQLNRVLSAILMSNIEHRQKYPGFLEQWKRTHNGTLEGASDAWVDYADNNNRYVYGKDARGTVNVKKQESLIEPKVWLKLREMNAVKVIPGNGGSNRVFIKQPNGKYEEQ